MGDIEERTMYVGNLHDDATDELLYELFLQAGPLQSIKRVKDRETGRLKNFAFVVFTHAASVPYAIHLTNGLKLCGRPLKTQQRNNIDLPHYLSVGVHTIESESDLQQKRSVSNTSRLENNPQGHEGGHRRNDRQDGNHFKPRPLDPNQVWKNNIDYNQRQQVNHYVSNAMMTVSSPNTRPDTNQRNNGRSSSNSYSGGSPAHSASHYHQMNSNILNQMSGSSSGDFKNRLGNTVYCSTRDEKSRSYSSYNTNRSYDGSHSRSGRYSDTGMYNRSRSSAGYSPYDVNMRAYGGNADRRGSSSGGGSIGPESMQHRLGGSHQDGRHRSYDNRESSYRHRR
ncbi:RNA recognition motif domain [Trinorchestia longiramus]|nr:RNA recognition motif domain [Trinorchestia longiramus]